LKPSDALLAALEPVAPLPRRQEGPVFREPWEAQAFALTLSLHERGLFTWPEWAAYLSDAIKRAQAEGDPDEGDTYYQHWLSALEAIAAAKQVTDCEALQRRKEALNRAAHATPHGQPILLERDPLHGQAPSAYVG
jgi:nitrile hydratase accessory protein